MNGRIALLVVLSLVDMNWRTAFVLPVFFSCTHEWAYSLFCRFISCKYEQV